MVNHQMEVLELGNKIQTKVKDDIDKNQREYYLRQQMKAIRQELGETDENAVETDEYRKKIEEINLPEEAKKEALRELERLSRMHPSSAEYTVSSTYLDWMTALPWHQETADNLDIAEARRVLDEDHYGLAKPKKRIIEYLAVRKLKPDSKGPIVLSVLRAQARHRWDIPSRGLWGVNLYACHWAVFMMRRKSAVIAAHTSALCPDALFRGSDERNQTIPFLCLMR
jgi:ATP-dependent Lon protease